jgi:hypothetical protein
MRLIRQGTNKGKGNSHRLARAHTDGWREGRAGCLQSTRFHHAHPWLGLLESGLAVLAANGIAWVEFWCDGSACTVRKTFFLSRVERREGLEEGKSLL